MRHAFVGSNNPQLSACWVNDDEQAIRIVSKAIRNNEGDVKATAFALNIGRTTLNRWISEHKELRKVLADAREEREERKQEERENSR